MLGRRPAGGRLDTRDHGVLSVKRASWGAKNSPELFWAAGWNSSDRLDGNNLGAERLAIRTWGDCPIRWQQRLTGSEETRVTDSE